MCVMPPSPIPQSPTYLPSTGPTYQASGCNIALSHSTTRQQGTAFADAGPSRAHDVSDQKILILMERAASAFR